MYSIILCGGSGTRLWPLSRKNYPKQFLKLYSDKSLLQETFLRIAKVVPKKNIVLVTNETTFFSVFNQIKEIYPEFSREQILAEKTNRNTAPAIAYAFKYLLEKRKAKPNDSVIILPADHFIGQKSRYSQVVKKAMRNVGDNIGTIGIVPTSPETGYGYIKKSGKKNNYGYYQVKEFKEKPNKKTAERYLRAGTYLWNSGMYIFNYRTFAQELKKHAPDIYRFLKLSLKDFAKKFSAMPSVSIDYALSEKSDRVVVFEGSFGWNDIGSFDSLAEIADEKKKNKNANHIKLNSENVFIHSTTNKLIATMNVKDLIVVENNDSILIQKKGRSEEVKEVVEYLKKNNYKEINHNIIVHRPWGRYEVLIDGRRHKVRKLTIYPGEKLNLQLHYHRVEHWIIIKGTAEVLYGDDKKFLGANQSIFIPQAVKHQIGNPGKINLEIIEVQTGNYLGDDDVKIFPK